MSRPKPDHETLSLARSFIPNPKKWTQEANARNANKDEVNVQSTDARCYCAAGAIQLAVWFHVEGTYRQSITTERLKQSVFREADNPILKDNDHTYPKYEFLEGWNDDRFRRHAEVLKAFDMAIDRAYLEALTS